MVQNPLLISQVVLLYISIVQKEIPEDEKKRKYWPRKSSKASSVLRALRQEESRSQQVFCKCAVKSPLVWSCFNYFLYIMKDRICSGSQTEHYVFLFSATSCLTFHKVLLLILCKATSYVWLWRWSLKGKSTTIWRKRKKKKKEKSACLLCSSLNRTVIRVISFSLAFVALWWRNRHGYTRSLLGPLFNSSVCESRTLETTFHSVTPTWAASFPTSVILLCRQERCAWASYVSILLVYIFSCELSRP